MFAPAQVTGQEVVVAFGEPNCQESAGNVGRRPRQAIIDAFLFRSLLTEILDIAEPEANSSAICLNRRCICVCLRLHSRIHVAVSIAQPVPCSE